MGVSYNSKIVTDGLVLALDAANPKSYPGSGNTCFDISGNENTATILPDVTFSTSPNKFSFPTSTSTNSRIVMNHSPVMNYSYINWCYSLWIKQLVDDDGDWAQLFIKGDDGGNRRPGVWFASGASSRLHITWNHSSQGQLTLDTTNDFLLPINVWHNIVIQSRNGVMMAFKDTVQDINTLSISERNTTTEPLHIGHRGGYRSLNMEISNFMLYNRSLTDAEIKQNFNATRGRYGV
jgi:hypothetical protein